ncbi:MAG TPA: hypothetical protein VIN58_22190 [Roseateles sp.]
MADEPPRSRANLYTLAAFGVFLALIALAFVGLPERRRPGELQDPAVRTMFLECGNENAPPGTGMPAWPDGQRHHYTRQRWADDGALKVEVWEFLEPGHVLVSANRKVDGKRIVIEPRWEVPPNAPVAACLAKLGIEVTFRGLPRGDYVVEAYLHMR